MRAAEKRLLSNTIFLYVMQICGYVFPLLAFPYLTRVLGPAKYGIVVLSNAVLSYLQMLIEFGFILSATNSCSAHHEDKTKLAHITIGVIQAKILLAVIGAAVLFTCCQFVGNFKDERVFFWLSYIGITLSIFLPDYLFRGIEQMRVIAYRVILSKLVYLGLIFLFVRADSDYLKVPLAAAGGNLVAVCLTWYVIIRRLGLRFTRVSFRETIQYLRESSPFFLSRIAVSMYQSLNTVLLGLRFSSPEIARYGAANTLAFSGRGMLGVISESIYPYMIKQKNYRLVKKIILTLEPIVIIFCVWLFIFSKPIVTFICGEQYAEAAVIFRAMLPLIVISLPGYLLGYPTLGALKRIKAANASVITASMFHLTGLAALTLMERLNFISVALLTFCTECVVLAIRARHVVKGLSKG
jgi:PST family polysaccharide transporter